MLLVVLPPLSVATGVLSAVLSSLLSRARRTENVGETMGFASSIGSFTRVVSPSVGERLIEVLGAWVPGELSVMIGGRLVSYARCNVGPSARDETGARRSELAHA